MQPLQEGWRLVASEILPTWNMVQSDSQPGWRKRSSYGRELSVTKMTWRPLCTLVNTACKACTACLFWSALQASARSKALQAIGGSLSPVGLEVGHLVGRITSRSHFSINAIMTILNSARSFQSIMSLIVVFLPHYVSAHWPTGPFWTDQTFHYLNFHIAFLNLIISLFCHPFQCIVAMIYSSWNYRRQQPNRGVLQRGVWARLRRKQVSQII